MSEEIKQKAMENWKNKYPLNTLKGESRKEFEEFIDTTLSQALQKRDEEWLRKIRNYQNDWVIMHDRGSEEAPEPEFAPEYDVIEQLLSTLTTK